MDKEPTKKPSNGKEPTLMDYAVKRLTEQGIKFNVVPLPKNYMGVIFRRRPLQMPTTTGSTEDTSESPEKDPPEEKR